MPQNRGGGRNQRQPNAQTKPAPPQMVEEPVPALVESREPEVVYYQPEEDKEIPANRFMRWLYYRSQIVLSALTFGVLLFYAIQWWEYRSTRELENRAYVTAKEAIIVPDPNDPTVNDIFVTVVNTGRTPGLNGNTVTQLELRETSPPEETVVNPPEKASSKILFGPQIDISRRAGIMAAPPTPQAQPSPDATKGGKVSASNTAPIPTPTPAPIVPPNDNKLWYVYGVVTYEDVFGKTHRTKFCYRNAPGTSLWWYCPTYNEAN